MHWAQSKRIGKHGLKCLAYKRSNSVGTSRKQFRERRNMAPSPETQTYMGEEEEEPLLGTQNPSEKTGVREKAPKSILGRRQKPDGLLAWAVAFANFLINLAVVGLGRMSGILYVVLMKKFHVDRQTASYPFSVQQATRNLFGPLAGILGQKYGVRNVTVVGGFIGVASAVACYFATDMNWITAMWGLIFGICTAFTTTLNQVPIDQYFKKHRTTAGGLAFSGGCVGAFFFPVVIEQLIDHYGISRTFLAMGGIILVVVPAALFLGEPPWKKHKVGISEPVQNYSTFRTPNDNAAGQHPRPPDVVPSTVRSAVQPPPGRTLVDFSFLRQHSAIVYQLFALTILTDDSLGSDDAPIEWTYLETEPLVQELQSMREFLGAPPPPQEPPAPQSSSLSDSSGSVVDELTRSVHEIKIVVREEPPTPPAVDDGQSQSVVPVSPQSYSDNPRWVFLESKLRELTYRDLDELLTFFPSHVHVRVQGVLQSMNTLSNEVHRLTKRGASPPPTPVQTSRDRRNPVPVETKPEPERSNSFLQHLKTALVMHKNPLFLLICLCRGVFMLTFLPMVTIVVDFAVDQGLGQDTGKYVIAVLSLGDLLGRLCLGWVTDSGCVGLSRYMLVVMGLLGASSATLPYMKSEVTLMPAILAFGMLQGSLFVRHQILVSKYMEEHEQAIGMGFINLLSGFLGFALPYYIGYFRDTQGSYDGLMYTNGIICACVGLLWVLEPYFLRFTPKAKRDKYEELTRDTGLG